MTNLFVADFEEANSNPLYKYIIYAVSVMFLLIFNFKMFNPFIRDLFVETSF